jgi:hypothetical protein
MEKLLNSHLDEIDTIEEELDALIDAAIGDIDFDALLKDPQAEITRVTQDLMKTFVDEYGHTCVDLGVTLAKKIQARIEQDKAIKIQDSNNPNLNKP